MTCCPSFIIHNSAFSLGPVEPMAKYEAEGKRRKR